jgi:hypothetical protein
MCIANVSCCNFFFLVFQKKLRQWLCREPEGGQFHTLHISIARKLVEIWRFLIVSVFHPQIAYWVRIGILCVLDAYSDCLCSNLRTASPIAFKFVMYMCLRMLSPHIVFGFEPLKYGRTAAILDFGKLWIFEKQLFCSVVLMQFFEANPVVLAKFWYLENLAS